MGIPVREALTLNVLDRTRVVAGEQGLDRVIKWVNILEVLDEISLLQEGELLITTAFGLADNPGLQEQLVPYLAERQLAGLAIQTGHYLQEIPQQLIEQCNLYGLPLLELPKSAAFTEITRAILKRVVNRQMDMLEYAQKIHLELTQVVLQDEGLPRIAQVLSDLTHTPVRIFDRHLHLMAFSGLPADDPLVNPETIRLECQALKKSRFLGASADLKSAQVIAPNTFPHVPGQVIQPIMAGVEIHGYISVVCHRHPLGKMDMLAVQAAATVSALEMLKEKAVWEAEERVKGDFLDDLMDGNLHSRDSLHRRANYLGYDLSKSFTVLLVDIDYFTRLSSTKEEAELQDIKRQVLSTVRFCLQAHSQQTLIKYKSDNVIVLLQVEPGTGAKEAREMAELVRQKTKQEMPLLTVSIGVGRCYSDLADLTRSLHEAEQALSVGKRLWHQDRVTFYDDLGIYRLFTGNDNQEELQNYYRSTIHPLADYDRLHNSSLVQTLEAFFQHNGEIKETSGHLFVHRHTLKYRLNRVREITGLDPEDCQDRFQLQLGLAVGHLLSEV